MGVDGIDSSTVNRRYFLAFSLGMVAALSLGPVAGIGQAAEIKFPEGTCGGRQGMKKRALVAYASKYGSTGGVADAIGKVLCGREVACDVLRIKNVTNITSYQAVVVGSAIYRGRWMTEAVDFLKDNREILRKVPVAYFLVCMTLARPGEKNRAEVLSYMDPVLEDVPEIKPVGIGTFAGAMDYSNLSFFNRKILKSKGTPEGDFRDWDAIKAWAREPVSAKFAK